MSFLKWLIGINRDSYPDTFHDPGGDWYGNEEQSNAFDEDSRNANIVPDVPFSPIEEEKHKPGKGS